MIVTSPWLAEFIRLMWIEAETQAAAGHIEAAFASAALASYLSR